MLARISWVFLTIMNHLVLRHWCAIRKWGFLSRRGKARMTSSCLVCLAVAVGGQVWRSMPLPFSIVLSFGPLLALSPMLVASIQYRVFHRDMSVRCFDLVAFAPMFLGSFPISPRCLDLNCQPLNETLPVPLIWFVIGLAGGG